MWFGSYCSSHQKHNLWSIADWNFVEDKCLYLFGWFILWILGEDSSVDCGRLLGWRVGVGLSFIRCQSWIVRARWIGGSEWNWLNGWLRLRVLGWMFFNWSLWETNGLLLHNIKLSLPYPLKAQFRASTLGQPHHISKPLGPNNRTSIWMSSLRVAIYTLINKSSKMLCTTTASLSNYSWYSATNLVCLREISSSWGDLICVIIPRTTTSQEQFPQNTVKLKAITLIHSTHRYEISLHLS